MPTSTDHRPAFQPSRRGGLALATAVAAGLLGMHPAHAQDASSLAAIQKQIGALQAQLKRLQHQSAMRDQQLKQAQDDAAQARTDAAQARRYAQPAPGSEMSAPPGYVGSNKPGQPFFAAGNGRTNPNASSLQESSPRSVTGTSVDKNAPAFKVGNMTVTLGGYIDSTAEFRSRSLTAGTSTSFSGIPYNNAVNGHIGEFHMTAQPSRFGMLVEGPSSPTMKIAGYFEGDLNAAPTSANSVQTNSYSPRMRLAYATFDDAADGWHLLAGQNWSLVTGSVIGITPRRESLPPVIDANYFPGFVYTRQAQIRVVKNFGKTFWLGASIENPQETYSFAGATATTGAPNIILPNGSSLSYQNAGGSFFNVDTTYSYDVAPDMVVKAAVDTRFGHFEGFGLGRFLRTRTSTVGFGDTHTVFGGGIGGSAVVPIWPKYIDLVGNVLAGDGVGRYGTAQLPDATFDAEGKPVALRSIMGMAGLVAHPNKSVDLYGFAGTQSSAGSSFRIKNALTGKYTGYGYGTPYASDAGCDIELGSCSAQTRQISDLTVGGWWRFIHGNYGTIQAGVQYSYVKKIAFSGVGGKPTTDDNIAFFSLRFLPFQ